MKSLRSRIAIAVSTAVVAVLITAIVTWTVHAQSAQTGPAATPPMDHMMMHGQSQATPEHQHMHGMAAQSAQPPMSESPKDPRELVGLPAPMQEHMLGNMRDHLATLNEIIGDVADSKVDAAAKIAEQRLGMSSLSLHGAAHLAPYLPKPMQDIGTSMHHAASRLVIVLQDASITPTADAMRDIYRALHEVTTTCEGCHAAYRVR
jgi:hypothetical protein